jgi:hypothetical protein
MKKEKEEATAVIDAADTDKEPETIEEIAEAVRRGDATAKQALAAYAKEGKVVLVALKYPTMLIWLEAPEEEVNFAGGKIHRKPIAGKALQFKRNKAVIGKEDYDKYLNNGNVQDTRTRFNGIDFMEEGLFRERIRHPASRKWALKVKEDLTGRRQVVDERTKEAALDFETILEEFHPNKIGGVIKG